MRARIVTVICSALIVACAQTSTPIETPQVPITPATAPAADDEVILQDETAGSHVEPTLNAPATVSTIDHQAHDSALDEIDQKAAPAEVQDPTVTVIAGGDMMLGGTGTEFYRRDNYNYAFSNVRDLLTRADVFIGNIETALTYSDEILVEKKYRFRNPPDLVSAALARAGLDIANLANNHSLDYGYSGLDDTIISLESLGIQTIGAAYNSIAARQPAIIDIQGTRIGFLAYSNTFPEEFWAGQERPGTAFGHEHHVRNDVQKLLAERADVAIVSFHWGREGTTELRDYQVLLGRAAIDAGASVVIGHHPHILQAVERYGDGAIAYSLGNFTFGSYSRSAKTSALAQMSFRGNKLSRIEFIPLNVFNQEVLFAPRILTGVDAHAVINELKALSAMRDTQLEGIGDRAVLEFD
ncbi:MAG: CapA family protein [Pseudomonadota bacterium]